MANEYERKPIPKRTRFEVFKRDKFTCQYCGRKSPEVTLEVDHIKPVAEGGTNDILNLITACFDCNRGKSKIRLDDSTEIQKQQRQLELLAERREQLAMMLEWRRELSNTDDEVAVGILNYLFEKYGTSLTDDKKARSEAIRFVKNSWMNYFGTEEILDAIDTASKQYGYATMALRRVGGICYNKRNGLKANQRKPGATENERIIAYLWNTTERTGVDDDVCDAEKLSKTLKSVGCAMAEGLIDYGIIETLVNAFEDDPHLYAGLLNTFASLYEGGKHGD